MVYRLRRSLGITATLLIVAVSASGCPLGRVTGEGAVAAGKAAGVIVEQPAVSDLADSLGRSSKSVYIESNTVDSLAAEVRVTHNEISDAATEATQRPAFTSSVMQLRQLYVTEVNEVVKATLRAATVETACEVLKGKEVTVQDFYDHLYQAGFTQLTPSQFYQLLQKANSTIVGLNTYLQSSDPRDRSAVAVLCYAAGVIL
jgi:hypothetical protein